MYTQCPECSVAFRVTAAVLKQAAGRVRCGGCGSPFNALEHLSEERPHSQTGEYPEPDLPELEPDPEDPGMQGLPRSLSAEQSAALLKTLDQLAGEDIRIEDTGVEWRVLGVEGEFEESDEIPGDAAGPEAIAPSANEDMRFDDDTPLPDDFDFQSEPIAAPTRDLEPPEPAPDDEGGQVDLALGDTVEWEALLDEVGAAGQAEDADAIEVTGTGGGADAGMVDVPAEMPPGAAMLDVPAEIPPDAGMADAPAEIPPDAGMADAQTEISPEAGSAELDLSGLREALREDGAGDAPDAGEAVEPPLAEGALTVGGGDEEAGEPEPADGDEPLAHFPFEVLEDSLEQEAEADAVPLDAPVTQIEAELEEREQALREQLLATADDESPEPADRTTDESIYSDLSEEEKTINLMIDKDLLAVAVEDADGFVSTIVSEQPPPAADVETEAPAPALRPAGGEDTSLVETIIMEGESVRRALDDMAEENRAAAAVSLAAVEKEVEPEPDSRPRRGMLAAAIGLALLFSIQFVHQSREALATVGVINSAIGPIYRVIGQPIAPAWDISGWRFEATKGSTDDAGQLLTIYSRIGNTATKAMPYPVIHVALTDRFEEAIGSRIMDPAEYLVGGIDPGGAVAPGETFNAVISIDSPSPDATGFQLNVCYRLPGTRLRCAIEDFR